MHDILLIAAGIGGILVALGHGALGQTTILSRITDLPRAMWRVNAAVFQLSTIYWLLGGLALVAAPYALPPTARFTVAIGVAGLYLLGAVANIWATRGRHFGGPVLVVVAALAVAGA